MPWVRLHGVKDYYDIAWLSQEYEGWKQTINLVPSLLEQIERYTQQSASDTYLDLSRKPAGTLSDEEKKNALEFLFHANFNHLIHPHSRYDELNRKRNIYGDSAWQYFTEQDFLDLQVWHNLAWIDPIWRNRPDQHLYQLVQKGKHFSEQDKHYVLDQHIQILDQVISIHKRLYSEGKIELTCSPYFHPILPLLCDSTVAKISNPRDPVPQPPFVYPEDAAEQIRRGIEKFERIFGTKPLGMWPSEGSVSDQALSLIASAGIHYSATDENILFRSTTISGGNPGRREELYRLHNLTTESGTLNMIFRDHTLSDLIGFTYQNVPAKEAAEDFIKRIRECVRHWQWNQPPLVNVILDGENCWEFYPNDGHDFLRYMIEGILRDPQIIPTTVPEYQKQYPAEPTLSSIFPGSWINNNFRIWIGHQEDNSAWQFLRQAREALTGKQDQLDPSTLEEAWKTLCIAEGSDWFWWYGDENYTELDWLFDLLFREHLIHLYFLLDIPIPEGLNRPIIQPQRLKETGVGILFQKPDIQKEIEHYYDWIGARQVQTGSEGGAMHIAQDVKTNLRYARMENYLCFSITFHDHETLKEVEQLAITITKPINKKITLQADVQGVELFQNRNQIRCIISLEEHEVKRDQEIWFFLSFQTKSRMEFSLPARDELYLQGYTNASSSIYWFS